MNNDRFLSQLQQQACLQRRFARLSRKRQGLFIRYSQQYTIAAEKLQESI